MPFSQNYVQLILVAHSLVSQNFFFRLHNMWELPMILITRPAALWFSVHLFPENTSCCFALCFPVGYSYVMVVVSILVDSFCGEYLCYSKTYLCLSHYIAKIGSKHNLEKKNMENLLPTSFSFHFILLILLQLQVFLLLQE